MPDGQQSENSRVAPEIAVTLAGRRFGVLGFDAEQTARIAAVLHQNGSISARFEPSWLAESAYLGDALIIQLGAVGSSALQAVSTSGVPALMVGPAESVLGGVAGAYGWARDFLAEPWTDAELLVRLFRLVAPAPDYPAPAEARPQPLILMADDDPAWIPLAEQTLRTHGLTCRTATDGLATLRLARQLLPDLLVLDLKMPAMDGLQVLETIRREPLLEKLPVALLTGCDEPAEAVRAAALHANDYLLKPVSPTVLLNRVKRLLAAAPGGPHVAEGPGPATPAAAKGA